MNTTYSAKEKIENILLAATEKMQIKKNKKCKSHNEVDCKMRNTSLA